MKAAEIKKRLTIHRGTLRDEFIPKEKEVVLLMRKEDGLNDNYYSRCFTTERTTYHKNNFIRKMNEAK